MAGRGHLGCPPCGSRIATIGSVESAPIKTGPDDSPSDRFSARTRLARAAALPQTAWLYRHSVAFDFRILGALEVFRDGELLPLGGMRQRMVLAVLLLHAREIVSAERLIDEVWDEAPPETARNVLQSYVSQLRKALGESVIATRGRGYMLAPEPGEVDLERFERLVESAEAADPAVAAARLAEALALWRGAALADVAEGTFLRAAADRLEELRLSAIERRIDAELALGRSGELAGELTALVSAHPLREQLRALHMLALYRAGRQADALAVFRDARSVLVERLGIEPSPALRVLETAILRHDPALELHSVAPNSAATSPGRSIVVAPSSDAAILPLCSIGELLARQPPRELIVVRLLDEYTDATRATRHLAELRDELVRRGVAIRVAAYTSAAAGDDAVLLAAEQDTDLILTDAHPQLLDNGLPDARLRAILDGAPCDVAVLAGSGAPARDPHGPVIVPFGGADHDWAAVELAAWTARCLGTRLRLVGTSADRFRRRRDASRLLARVSLVVQAAAGIVAEPVLVRPGAEGVLEAAKDASLLIVGLSPRWAVEGLGAARLEIARRSSIPTILVRRGLRPGGLAPGETMTRFAWTLGPAAE
jgi:DNA-binding SARP family transcriptional activator